MKNTISRYVTLPLVALFLALPLGASAATYEEALAQVQIDIISAYSLGDINRAQELFFVFFELLMLGDQYDHSDGYDDGSVDVETQSAKNIGRYEAELRGEVDLSGGVDEVYVWFEYGEDDDDLDEETSHKRITRDSDISADIDDLDRNERYYFRLVAENRDTDHTYYGKIKSFVTDAGGSYNDDVEVETLTATHINNDEATLRGKVLEGDDVEVWFAFDEDDSTPSCLSHSQRQDPDGYTEYDEDDIFQLDIDGLDEGDRYYFRACAEDEDGDEVSGAIRSFIADEDDDDEEYLRIETGDTDDITDDSAELNGEIELFDTDTAYVWFEYGEDEDEFDYETSRVRVTRDSDITADIYHLDDDTRYYYRAVARDDDTNEVFYGDTEDFRTDD